MRVLWLKRQGRVVLAWILMSVAIKTKYCLLLETWKIVSFEFKENVLTTLGKTVLFYLEKCLNKIHADS